MKVREELRAGRYQRDRELVRLIGRHGAMTIEQVMRAMGCGRTATYRRFARCESGGLVERCPIPGLESSVLRATREGLRYAGLGLPVAAISPATVGHMVRCTSAALHVGERVGHERVLTEREILFEEQIRGKPLASVRVGMFRGQPRVHRADIALLSDSGTIAIEVELTPKAPARLRQIVRAWLMAIHSGAVSEVHYLCAPGQTFRAVERAVLGAGAKGHIAVLDVGEVSS
ncbi:MAG TPA: hypothetical protein VFM51_08445 [Solirubrobacterales bacterium]|nr:hypothetical protein [Solirubrobacterales bacterium]